MATQVRYSTGYGTVRYLRKGCKQNNAVLPYSISRCPCACVSRETTSAYTKITRPGPARGTGAVPKGHSTQLIIYPFVSYETICRFGKDLIIVLAATPNRFEQGCATRDVQLATCSTLEFSERSQRWKISETLTLLPAQYRTYFTRHQKAVGG